MKKNLKRLAAAGLSAILLLSGCAAKNRTEDARQQSMANQAEADVLDNNENRDGTESVEAQSAERIFEGKPWMNTMLEGTVTDEVTAAPVEDFNLYTNREWFMKNSIPDGKNSYAEFDVAEALLNKNKMALLEDDSLTGHDAELIQGLYSMLLDWDARNAQGLEPIRPGVERITAIRSLDEMTGFLLDRSCFPYINPMFGFGAGPGYSDASMNTVWVMPGELMLADAAEYENPTGNGERLKKTFQGGAVYMLERFGYSREQAEKTFENAVAFEKKVAESMMTLEDYYSEDYSEQANNPRTFQELEAESPEFPLTQIMKQYGFDNSKTYQLEQPDWLRAINEVYTEENLQEIKDYQLVSLMTSSLSFLDEDAFRKGQELNQEYAGSTGVETDEELACQRVYSLLQSPFSKVYVERYCTEEMKESITGIINRVVVGYRSMLAKEDWLSEETRDKAIEKLDHIRIFAAYPEEWLDFSSLDLSAEKTGGLFGAIAAIDEFYMEYSRSQINQKVNKDLWETCMDVNAAYSSSDNAIYIGAGILNGVYYQDSMTEEEKMGAIGVVISHEISHAFDPSGAQFDKDGNFNNWWTEEDYEAFQERSHKLTEYYDRLEPLNGLFCSGDLVMGEAVADMGGMKCMLELAEAMPEFDYDQFFTAYARMWRGMARRNLVEANLASDPHPLWYLRINTVLSQFEEFHNTYGVKAGDPMYTAPEERVKVW